MSPDEILWAAPDRGGLTSAEWEIVVDYLTRQLATFLNRDIERSSEAFISPGKSLGFSVDFWSVNPIAQPIDFHVRGTFGASDHEGTKSAYIGVQGWLYPYVAGQRMATTRLGHNHIYLRYAKADAADDDWEMLGCAGAGSWRSLGWSPDTYGEFDGLDEWDEILN